MAVDTIVLQYKADVDDLKVKFAQLEKDFGKQEAHLKKVNTEVSNVSKNIGGGLGGALSKIGPMVAGVFSIGAVMSFTNKLIEATSQSQKFGAVLGNALGSNSEGQKAMAQIRDFAAKTPFSINEITESFVKLVNRGFKPTEAEMTKLGDLAASQGKSLDMLTEAILDAQVGEGERLKEFGVRMAVNGDKVSLSFKGITKEVKNNEAAIRDAIIGFGDMQGVAGSMAVIAQTTGGKISNLGDAFDQLAANLGNNASPAFDFFIDRASSALSGINELVTGLTPLADKLTEAKAGLNAEVSVLEDGNISFEDRKALIDQINIRYGEYLPNLLDEKMSMQEIRDATKEANIELDNRILITAKQETLSALLKKQADEMAKQYKLKAELNKLDEQGLTKTEQIIRTGVDFYIGTNTSVEGIKLHLRESEMKLSQLKKDYINFSQAFDKDLKKAGIDPNTKETALQKKQREAKEAEDLKRQSELSAKEKEAIRKKASKLM